jgi:phosphohistidine swiveling domain-containing protein
VEAVHGSPAALVTGRAEPYRYVREALDREWRMASTPTDAQSSIATLDTASDPLDTSALDRLRDVCNALARDEGTDVDVEFAFTAGDEEPWILQCRPVTARARSEARRKHRPHPSTRGFVAGTAGVQISAERVGIGCSAGSASGRGTDPARIAIGQGSAPRRTRPDHGDARAADVVRRGVDRHRTGAHAAEADLSGTVVLLERLTVDDYPLVFRCAAVVTERRDAQLGHAAIACREIGLPYVAGITDARARLHGCPLIVDGTAGVVTIADQPRPSIPEPNNPDVPQTEPRVAAIERLVLEALPYCADTAALERHVRRSLGDPAATEDVVGLVRSCLALAPGEEVRTTGPDTPSFTAEERELLRRFLTTVPAR